MGCHCSKPSQVLQPVQPRGNRTKQLREAAVGRLLGKSDNHDVKTMQLFLSRPDVTLTVSWGKSDFADEVKKKIAFLDEQIAGPVLKDDMMLRSVFTQFGYAMQHTVAQHPAMANKRVVTKLLSSTLVPEWFQGFNQSNQSAVDSPEVTLPPDFLENVSKLLRVRMDLYLHALNEETNIDDLLQGDGPLFLEAPAMDVCFAPTVDDTPPCDSFDNPDLSPALDEESVLTLEPDDPKMFQLRQDILRVTYDLMNCVLRSTKLQTLFSKADFNVSRISSMKNTVSAAAVAALMEVESPFPVFLGGESAGKSTLINFLLDPTGDGTEVLPTAATMCSQHIAVVKKGHACQIEFKGHAAPAGQSLKDQLRAGAEIVMKKRAGKTLDLATSIAFLRCPFKGEGECFVDVPGIKEETLHETQLVLAVTGALVLVAPDLDILTDQLSEGGQLHCLPRLYENIAPNTSERPPIFVAVTKTTKTDFDKECQRQLNYEKLIATHFKACNPARVKVIFANCRDKDQAGNLTVDRFALASEFFKFVEDAPQPPSWQVRYEQARGACQDFWGAIEKIIRTMGTKSATVKGAGSVEVTAAQSFRKQFDLSMRAVDDGVQKLMRDMLAAPDKKNYHAQSLANWLEEINPAEILRSMHADKVRQLPFTTMIMAGGQVIDAACKKVHVMAQIQNEYRASVALTVMAIADEMFDRQWKCFTPMIQPLIMDKGNVKPMDAFDHTTGSQVKLTAQFMQKNLTTWFQNVIPHIIHQASQCEHITLPEEPSDISNQAEAHAHIAQWEHVASYAISICSNKKIFPFLLVGHYTTVTDEMFDEVLTWNVGRRNDQAASVKALEQTRAATCNPAGNIQAGAISRFPSCTSLQDWQEHLATEAGKVASLRDAEKRGESAVIIIESQIDAVKESSERVCRKLMASDLFKTKNNPLVRRLCDLVYKLMNQCIVRYEYRDGAQFSRQDATFTPAGEALNNANDISTEVQEIVEFLNIHCYDSAISALTQFARRRHSEDNRSRNGGGRLYRDLMKSIRDFKHAHEKIANGTEVKESIYVADMASGEGASASCQSLAQGFQSVSNQTTSVKHNSRTITSIDNECAQVVGDLKHQKPTVVVLIRRADVADSHTPTAGEKKLLTALSGMAFVGRIYIVSSKGFVDPAQWEMHLRKAPVNFVADVPMPRVGSCRVVDAVRLAELGAEISNDYPMITRLAADRAQQAEAYFHGSEASGERGAKVRVGECLRMYAQHKVRRDPMEVNAWFDEQRTKVEELLKDLEEFAEVDELRVPCSKLFMFEPFTERRDARIDHHEMEVRRFHQRVIMPQVMRNGYNLGLHVYDRVIAPLMDMLADKFGTSSDQLMKHLTSVAESSMAKRASKAASQRDPTTISAEFLRRENFAHMYAGGVTFAAAPMLMGMIQGILQNGDKEYTMDLANELARQSFDYLSLLRRGVEVVTPDS